MITDTGLILIHNVASFAEAWIEILMPFSTSAAFSSPPSRRRGLKYPDCCFGVRNLVASFAEAWIEIVMPERPLTVPRRLLRGGVD